MLQGTIIGRLGGNAEVKNVNERVFTTMRVAHSSSWTDAAGVKHEETLWVDVVLDGQPKVVEYLKAGQLVYAQGSLSTRVYSSAKDHCMKAGITINAFRIELLGGANDPIPNKLYDANTGAEMTVLKVSTIPNLKRDETKPEFYPLVSRSGKRFVADRTGEVSVFEGTE